jgi:hypothetical protein
VESPEVKTGRGDAVTVLFEKWLQLECAFKLSGSLTILAADPTRLPETPVAVAGGKRPVRAGLQVAVRGDVFSFTIRGDAMNVSSVQLPPAQEPGHPRAVFEERMDHLRRFVDTIDALYAAFLKRRLSSQWPKTLAAVRTWVAAGGHAGQIPAELGAAS